MTLMCEVILCLQALLNQVHFLLRVLQQVNVVDHYRMLPFYYCSYSILQTSANIKSGMECKNILQYTQSSGCIFVHYIRYHRKGCKRHQFKIMTLMNQHHFYYNPYLSFVWPFL